MTQDTFDIDTEDTEFLWTPLPEDVNSPSRQQRNLRDDVADLSGRSEVPVPMANSVITEGYDSENVDTTRFDFFRQQFEQNSPALVGLPSFDTNDLIGIARFDEIVTKLEREPYSHEASIELVNKGFVSNAPYEYTASMLASLGDEHGLFRDTVDLAGVILLPDFLKDRADFLGMSVTNVAGGTNLLKRWVSAYQQLSPEQQRVVFPILKDKALEATEGNAMKAMFQLLPFLDPSVTNEVDLSTALGALDAGLVLGPLLNAFYRLAKTANTVRRISKLASKEAGGALVVRNLDDVSGNTSRALDIPRQQSATDAHPLNFGEELQSSADNLTGATAEAAEGIRAAQNTVKEAVDPILQNDYLKIRLLSREEERDFVKSQATTFKQFMEKEYGTKGYTIGEAKVIEQTDDGFRIQIDFTDAERNPGQFTSAFLNYTTDGILASNSNLKAGSVLSYVASPQVWLGAALKEGLVAESTLISFQQRRIAKILGKAQKEVWAGTTNKERGNVDKVLQAGSNYSRKDGDSVTLGKDYTYRELREGVDVGDGQIVNLTEKEITTYFKARELFRQNYRFLNKVQRDVLKSQNYMEASAFGRKLILRPYYRNKDEIPANAFGKDAVVGTSSNRTTAKITKKSIEDYEKSGHVLTKLYDENYIQIGSGSHSWAFVPKSSIKELRANPIKYVPGYVPRIYAESPYSVVKSMTVKVDGVETTVTKPVRLFSSRSEATKWAAANGGRAIHRSEVGEKTTAEMITQEAGGLFIDDRGEMLLYGMDGARPKLVSAQDAMDRQMSFIAQRMPMAEWRVSVVDRWVKEASRYLPNEVKSGGFNARLDAIGDPKVKNALEASRRWIKDQLMVPTPEERFWSRLSVTLADWVDGNPFTRPLNLHKPLLWASEKDPFAVLRGISFHFLLGALNPAQYIVQAQGFAVAAALDKLTPAQLVMRTRQVYALRAAADLPPTLAPQVEARLAKFGGWSVEEYRSVREAWRQSGLYESIRTTADLDSIKLGFHADNTTVGRILNSNLLFYREGELFTRGYSFLVARDAFLAAKAGKLRTAIHSSDDVIDIVERTTRKMFNLDRANRAQWQKGILSVPTQYQQITAKFIEAMLAGKGSSKYSFTGKEKGRIFAMQAILYGSAGIPFSRWLMEEAISMTGMDAEEIPETVKAGLRDGVWGALTEFAFDEGVSIGKRGAAISGLEQILKDIMSDRVDMAQMASGPVGEVLLNRGGYALQVTKNMLFNPNVPLSFDEVMRGANAWLSMASSWRNFHKGVVWGRANEILDQYGETVGDVHVDNLKAIIAYKFAGFGSITVDDIYALSDFKQHRDEIKREAKRDIKRMVASYVNQATSGAMTEEEMETMYASINWMLRMYDEPLATEIYHEVVDELWNGKEGKDEKNFREAMKTITTSGTKPPGGATLLVPGAGLNTLVR